MIRRRVARGIHRDQYGFDVRVKAGRFARTKRFPFDTPLKVMQAWQAHTRGELLDRDADLGPPPKPPRTTLAQAATRYLKHIDGRVSVAADRSHLRAWLPLYGAQSLETLTAEDVSTATARWKVEGVKDKTVLHRCRVLRELYQALRGKGVGTPVDDAKKPKTPHPMPVVVPLATIHAVSTQLEAAGDPQAYARFRVLVTTGQRPCQVMRARPIDLNLETQVWIVRPAKAEPAHPVYLNDEMVAAWRLFVEADAWGDYDTTKQARLLRACGWPADIRPYNARHSVAGAALERGADLGDVQGLLGHTQIQTTRSTYGPLQVARQRRVSELLAGRFTSPVPGAAAPRGRAGRR